MRCSPASTAVAVAAVAAALLAAPIAPARAGVTLTVYNENLALVRETRTIEVSPGVSTIEVADVPALIDPTSVHLRSVSSPDRVAVLEQNFVYDLATGDRLLERYLDRNVEVLTKQGNTARGVLRSFAQGSLVLEDAKAGQMTLVSKPEVESVILAGQDVRLVTRPMLVWLLKNDAAARQELEIDYLTGGLSWHAEYAGVLDDAEATLDLAAWVSLDNRSGKTYEDASLRVVAGDIHRAGDREVFKGRMVEMAAADASGFEAREFSEYKLYALERKTTVRDRETKQLSLFPNAETKVSKRFTYDGRRDASRVLVSYLFKNKRDAGLGMPLPAGTIRLYKEDGIGGVGLLGEDRIAHTPKDEEVEVAVGSAFDIVVEKSVIANRQISDRVQETDVEIRFRNHKSAAVDVLVREGMGGDWEILRSSFPSKRKDAQTAEFDVPVPADGETLLTYTARTRW